MIVKAIILFLVLDCGIVLGWCLSVAFHRGLIDGAWTTVQHLESQLEAADKMLTAATAPRVERPFTDSTSRVWWV